MNTLRMISRLFAIVTIAFVGNIYTESEYYKVGLGKVYNNKFTLGNMMIGNAMIPKDQHAAKAAFETLGVILDDMLQHSPKAKLSKEAIVGNFVVNLSTRRMIASSLNTLKTDSVEEKINSTPVVGQVSPDATAIIKAALPQMVATAVVMAASAVANAKSDSVQ